MAMISSLGAVLCAVVFAAGDASEPNQEFEAFVTHHSRTYKPGSREYLWRRQMFDAHVAAVEAINSAPGTSWRAGVNRFADRSPLELKQLRGYRRIGQHGKRSPMQLLTTKSASPSVDIMQLPRELSWEGKINATTLIQDQGQCGSCWAFASATVLRAHSELFRTDRAFSVQQIVSCTLNPLSCGGAGGCEGATAELAMDYVMRTGCTLEAKHPYTAEAAECPADMASRQLEPHPNEGYLTLRGASFNQVDKQLQGGLSFGMIGWRRLPENELEPVLEALYMRGPVAVSLNAGVEWNLYQSGVFDVCKRDAIIDHAVMLIGYGVDTETNMQYWKLQNSWSPSWGEAGYIRIKRLDNKDEKEYCGWDTQPEIGSGCSDGPSKVWVCGHCGILNDVVEPVMALNEHGWWSRHGERSVREKHAAEDELSTSRRATSGFASRQGFLQAA